MDESTPPGHLLIVDDEEGIRSALHLVFADLHYRVTDAKNGREALAFLRHTASPHVVLTDIMMPVMDGTTFMTALLADPVLAERHICCVMSAYEVSLAMALTRFIGTYPVYLIKKPFDLDHLITTVAEAQAHLAGRRPAVGHVS